MKLVYRQQIKQLRSLVENLEGTGEVILVEGARQVGKTTLVRQFLEQDRRPALSLNLEENTLFRSKIDACVEFTGFEDLLRDQLGFDPESKILLFIDEAQESRKLGSFVRFMKEKWGGARVILTGSTLTRLFREGVRYPVGRVKRIHVRPFSFSEFLDAGGKAGLAKVVREFDKPISKTRHQTLLEFLDDYLLVGGLPQVVTEFWSGGDWELRRREIEADYEQDFIRLFGEENQHIVHGCFRSVANFVGSPSKYSTVVRSASQRELERIKTIFARLEDWKLIHLSPQRGPSPESSYGFHPKRYLFDTGLLRDFREQALPRIDILETLDSASRTPLGGIVENQAAIELIGQFGPLQGWRKSSSGLEIDFIIKWGGTHIPCECKATKKIKKTQLRGLRGYLDRFERKTGMLFSFAPLEEISLGDGKRVINIPLYLAESVDAILEKNLSDSQKGALAS